MPDLPFQFIHHSKESVSAVPTGSLFKDKLRRYFQYQIDSSAHYASIFHKLGLNSTHEPFISLNELPPTTKTDYRETLQLEALTRLNESTFVTDFSSGSTADSVLRLCTPTDDLAEQSVTETAFSSVGMGPEDHFVCMDIGATEIYDFYFRAARNLGVRRTSFLHLTQNYAQSCLPLNLLQPTVLLTVPSLLIRVWPVIKNFWKGTHCPIISVIHMGEPMDANFKRIVEDHWKCQVRSFYGTTETGGIGMSCEDNSGIHFDPGLFIPTLEKATCVNDEVFEGEVLFTTLHIRTQSMIKYRVGDHVRINIGSCPCGNHNPRMTFLNRTLEAFIIAGEKFHHAMILEGLRESAPDLPFAILVIEDLNSTEGDALLRVQLPDSYHQLEPEFRATLENDIFELDALFRYGWVKFQIEFLPMDMFQGRKMIKVRDNRLHMGYGSREDTSDL
jgi:phenylacetate-coenzyme A ligase PaaK-like adenylate-forming protein